MNIKVKTIFFQTDIHEDILTILTTLKKLRFCFGSADHQV